MSCQVGGNEEVVLVVTSRINIHNINFFQNGIFYVFIRLFIHANIKLCDLMHTLILLYFDWFS